MRLRHFAIILLLGAGLAFAPNVFGQSSSGSGSSSGLSGVSSGLTGVSEGLTGVTTSSSSSNTAFIGGPPDHFIGRQETGGTRRASGASITRGATSTRSTRSGSGSSVNTARSTGGTGSSVNNQVPYFLDFDDEQRAAPELARLTGPNPESMKRMQAKIERLPRLKLPHPISVKFNGTEALLQGTVENPRDRLRIEQVLLLEPGIWSVKNELKVAAPAPSLGTSIPLPVAVPQQ